MREDCAFIDSKSYQENFTFLSIKILLLDEVIVIPTVDSIACG